MLFTLVLVQSEDWSLQAIQGLAVNLRFVQFIGSNARIYSLHEDCYAELGSQVCTGQSMDYPDLYFAHVVCRISVHTKTIAG